MSSAALEAYLDGERRRAAIAFALDEELGIHHGLSSSDFVLLHSLDDSAPMAEAALARMLGELRSRLLMRIRPLEKIGVVTRSVDASGGRSVALSAGGRRLLVEARGTAAEVCSRWLCK